MIDIRRCFQAVLLTALSLVCVLSLEANAATIKKSTPKTSVKQSASADAAPQKVKARMVKGALVVQVKGSAVKAGSKPEKIAAKAVSSKKKGKVQYKGAVVRAAAPEPKPKKKWIVQKPVPGRSYAGREAPQREALMEVVPPAQPRILGARLSSAPMGATPQHEDRAQGILKTAYRYLRTAYRMGGTGPSGFDCSGFTRFIFAKHGVALPHSSVEQAQEGKPIDKAELKPGDLVFFSTFRRGISHVGIFIANGLFIHSAGTGKGVSLDSLGSNYWGGRYRGARRVDLSSARQIALADDEVASIRG